MKLKLLAIRAHLDLRNRPRAISALQDALQLGRRCGLVRTFLDAGPQVTDLMRTLFSTDSEDAELLGYLDRLIGKDAKVNAAPGKSLSRKATAAPPVEMLTERELEIVGMLSRVLTNKKIARALGISEGTVKWHMKNIYGKLAVISRDEALARCRDLGLLG